MSAPPATKNDKRRVGSVKARKPAPPKKAEPAEPVQTPSDETNGQQPPDEINGQQAISYDEAVVEAREIIKTLDDSRHQLRLGELTALITDQGNDRTLAKFAEDIGIAVCTLQRYRSVYRAWKDIKAPGLSYAVLRALQDHPDREQLVKNDPKITKREAEKLRRDHKGKPKNNKSGDWKRDECKRWLGQIQSLANTVTRTAKAVAYEEEETLALLREIMEPALVPDLKAGGEALRKLADYLDESFAAFAKAA